MPVLPVYPSPEKYIPLIIHAPTQPSFKGTAEIESTLARLKQDGFQFDYRRIEHMSHAEAMSYYHAADLVIDQILVGTYGMFAVEAMTLGKPVVSYIREDLLSTFPATLPIISANPATLYDVLMPYLTSAELRAQKGRQSRQYAEERHDISRITPTLLDIYNVVLQYT